MFSNAELAKRKSQQIRFFGSCAEIYSKPVQASSIALKPGPPQLRLLAREVFMWAEFEYSRYTLVSSECFDE